MKHITKLAVSLFMILVISVCQMGIVFGAVKTDILSGDNDFLYNGVVIASATYLCESEEGEKEEIVMWRLKRGTASAKYPSTIKIKGATIYETVVKGGNELCTLTVGESYDIRIIFVHTSTEGKKPYYQLMIEGKGVTQENLTGSYVDGIWVSEKRNTSDDIKRGDAITAIYSDIFSYDYCAVADGKDDVDMYYDNHADFRNVVYSDGALHIDLLWAPKADSVTSENISVSSGEKQITVDKFVCEGNKISIYSKDFSRGQTYTVTLKDTMLTSRGSQIRIPLKTQYTIEYNDADIRSVVISNDKITLNTQNLTEDDFNFTVFVALKSDDGTVNEVIVCDPCIVEPNPQSVEIVIENLDFKSLTPEVFIVKSALLPVPVSDRSYK